MTRLIRDKFSHQYLYLFCVLIFTTFFFYFNGYLRPLKVLSIQTIMSAVKHSVECTSITFLHAIATDTGCLRTCNEIYRQNISDEYFLSLSLTDSLVSCFWSLTHIYILHITYIKYSGVLYSNILIIIYN